MDSSGQDTGYSGDIWEHVDPKKDQIPTLSKPELARPQQVNQDKTTYAELSKEEKEEFRMLRQD
jgi:hypothetical protein